jgi:hypothetical protein
VLIWLVVPDVLAVHVMASVEVAKTPPRPAYAYIPSPKVTALMLLVVPVLLTVHVTAFVEVARPPVNPATI